MGSILNFYPKVGIGMAVKKYDSNAGLNTQSLFQFLGIMLTIIVAAVNLGQRFGKMESNIEQLQTTLTEKQKDEVRKIMNEPKAIAPLVVDTPAPAKPKPRNVRRPKQTGKAEPYPRADNIPIREGL